MPDKLEYVWGQFQDKASEEIRSPLIGPKKSTALRLVTGNGVDMKNKVTDLESGPEFISLLDVVQKTFLAEGYHSGERSFWEWALRTFLRRSKFYINLGEGTHLEAKELISSLTEAFRRKIRNVTYLAPMEFVRFSGNPIVFRHFTIRSYSWKELDQLLQNSVNEVFYPSTYLRIKDLGNLAQYSFIVVTETESTERLGHLGHGLADVGKVNIKFSLYPPLEMALKELTLVDWEAEWLEPTTSPDSEWEQWERFEIPFVIRVTDDLLAQPDHRLDLSNLATTSYYSYNAETGEPEEDEGPDVRISLGTEQTKEFEAYVRKIDKLIQVVEAAGPSWSFFDRALSFLVKAFFTYDLEQLLWHIVALEGVLGEKGAGVTNRLIRRVSSILGKSDTERKQIRAQFVKLYDFRSQLVHGAEFEKQIWEGHLREARNLTRKVMVWFLHYLENIHGQIPADEKPPDYPRREELLLLLDIEAGTRNRLAKPLALIPAEFPYVASWLD